MSIIIKKFVLEEEQIRFKVVRKVMYSLVKEAMTFYMAMMAEIALKVDYIMTNSMVEPIKMF